jgi:aryl-alcohol dehydrogenase-like predicted oxidoreductase
MRTVRLGRSGLEVSALCFGCMSLGEPDRGDHEWTLPEEESRALVRHALEKGINFFDTANVYSLGSSEEILGRALRDMARRDEVVVATKLSYRVRPGPNGQGLSRRAIFSELDASLKRLGMDHVDLYQIHRWDPNTPIEETLEALNDVVRMGKVRYIGASSMFAWQFAKALGISQANGWARFISMQNHLNLLYREEEREMIPLCKDQGIGIIPWSPLARGRLSRPSPGGTTRGRTDNILRSRFPRGAESDERILKATEEVARSRGVSMAQIALAWVAQHDGVTAPILGATKLSHIDDAVAALDIKLTAQEIAALEGSYVPREVIGHN